MAQAVRAAGPHGFVIASDECYSEIYFRDEPPLGGLEAAAKLGRDGFRGWWPSPACPSAATCRACAAASSPATRPLLKQFLLYRTYHGSAMSPIVQAASIAAWNDEAARGGQPPSTGASSPK
jgi:N-succinyldiaminopimelate aminotransferase